MAEKDEMEKLRQEKEALAVALAQKQAEIDQVRRSKTAVVEARERRVQEQIDATMVHNEELEKEYDHLNAHAKQLTATVQSVVAERKELEAEIAQLQAEGYRLEQ